MWPPENIENMLAPLRKAYEGSHDFYGRRSIRELGRAVKAGPLSVTNFARLQQQLQADRPPVDWTLFRIRDPDDEDVREFVRGCGWGFLKAMAPYLTNEQFKTLAVALAEVRPGVR